MATQSNSDSPLFDNVNFPIIFINKITSKGKRLGLVVNVRQVSHNQAVILGLGFEPPTKYPVQNIASGTKVEYSISKCH